MPEPKPKRRPSAMQQWSLHVEQASLGMRGAVMERAVRAWDSLTPVQRMQAAREIAQARGAELTLAYRNVVMVSAGFRRQDLKGTPEKLTREPCVIFIVRRKWKKGSAQHADTSQPQFLPDRLLTHVTVGDGMRALVAVPTDVQPARRYAAARPQLSHGFHVRGGGQTEEYGTLTALLRVSSEPGHLYGLSALHVLTPDFGLARPDPQPGASVEVAKGLPQPPGAPRIGASLAIGGQIVPGPDISFDAQLMEIRNTDRVAQMLRGIPLSPQDPYVPTIDRYDELTLAGTAPRIEILVPHNHPLQPGRKALRADPEGTSVYTYAIPYGNAAGELLQVQHWGLIHLACRSGRETLPGDSGSPVVLWRADGTCTFVGMHIAGNGGLSHVLPAWLIMEPANYSGTLPEGCVLELAMTA